VNIIRAVLFGQLVALCLVVQIWILFFAHVKCLQPSLCLLERLVVVRLIDRLPPVSQPLFLFRVRDRFQALQALFQVGRSLQGLDA
jgi:hypothetical protein